MKRKILVEYRIERAKETIVEAEYMAKISHWNHCVNRLYYSCFYAVNSLLIANKMSSSKHTGVRALFNLHFIKTKIVEAKLGKLYNTLFVYRQQSDYEDLFKMTEELAVPWISLTKEFVSNIEQLILDKYLDNDFC